MRGRSSPSRRTITYLGTTACTMAASVNPRMSAQVISQVIDAVIDEGMHDGVHAAHYTPEGYEATERPAAV